MPPYREVEFVIDPLPGTTPTFKRPYRRSIEELKGLKKQLTELQEASYIRLSSLVGSSCSGEQVPTSGAHRSCYEKPPAMAPKRASSKAAPSVDEAAKAALLAEKKRKDLIDTTHQEGCEDDTLSKRQRNEQLTPEGNLRTCSSGGQPQPPPGFVAPEGADATEYGEVIGVSAEEQLQLRALRIKNRNLQKQKKILEAKHQRVSAQAKVR
jgi:hypothetical protein